MSKREKAIARLLSNPTDFTWDELVTVMAAFGYALRMGGGSSRKFFHPATQVTFMIHQPHPSNVLKRYQVQGVIAELTERGYL